MSEDNFKKTLITSKKVSVWGVGYLGYTTLLTLQKFGFNATVFDFNQTRLREMSDGNYPNIEQLNSLTKHGKMPEVDLGYIEIADYQNLLFENNLHIISFPNTNDTDYATLTDYFINNRDKLQDSLIIFQSAGTPNDIELNFIAILTENDIKLDVATIFRADWTIEEYRNKSNRRVVSGNSSNAIKKVNLFLGLLNMQTVCLESIKEAEVYENTKIALNYTISAFFNQLSLSYPDLNVDNMSQNILSELDVKSISLGVNSVDYKTEQSIDSLLAATPNDHLSILKEANSTNISFLYYYTNLLKNKNINSVSILGLSAYSNLKDLRFSPSIILAEHLNREGIKVCINDDNITEDELTDIMSFAEFIDINRQPIKSEVVVIMNLCNSYKFFTQEKIEELGLYKVKFILDNTGFFKNYMYSDKSTYHYLCDGSLIDILKA